MADGPFNFRISFTVNEARPTVDQGQHETLVMRPGVKPVVIQGPIPEEQATDNSGEKVAEIVQNHLYPFMGEDARVWAWNQVPNTREPGKYVYASVLVEFPEDVIFQSVHIGLMWGDLPIRGKWWEILEPGPDHDKVGFFNQWHRDPFGVRGVQYDGERSLFAPIYAPGSEGQ